MNAERIDMPAKAMKTSRITIQPSRKSAPTMSSGTKRFEKNAQKAHSRNSDQALAKLSEVLGL